MVMQPICGTKLAIVIRRLVNTLKYKCMSYEAIKYKQGWTGNENEVDVGRDFTILYEIKNEQSDTVNKDRQHEKYRYN